jgi:trigger factor
LQSTVEQLSPTRVKINVEVPFDELKPNFDRAYRKLAKQVRIPGFRPGKAPARVLESHIGRGVVLEEVVNEAIPAKYSEAVSSSEVKTIGQPDIELTDLADGERVAFSAEVDIRPEITVPDFSGIAVTVDDVEVTDEQVDNQLESLRARFGTLTGVDRAAGEGDFVSIDLSATVGGEDVPEASTSGLSYEVGSGDLIDGIDDALVGLSEGESTTFTTKLVAGEHAGSESEVTVTVQSVKTRELPEVDDEFAQLASEFDTVQELRDDLRERAARSNSMEQGAQARDKVLDALLEATEVPLPESIVEQEVEGRKEEALHAFDHDEERLAEYLQGEGKDRDAFDAEMREDAEKQVKIQLVLDQIAESENVQVGEQELTQRIIYQAQRFGVSPEEYVQRAQQSGQLGAIFADVRRGKALGSVVRAAAVTDESGDTVDMEVLFGEPEQDGGAAPEVVESDVVESEGAESETEAETAAS